MRHTVVGVVIAAVSALTCAPALAQSWAVPPESQRCPSKWGAGDERGSGNHMKPASVMRAAQLIKTGEVIEIAHVMNDKMPFFGTRRFDVHTKRTFMNDFSNRRGSNEEIVISEIGQVGTQFDGFAHQSHEDSHYNCFKTGDIATRGGFTKLGIEKVGDADDPRRADRRGGPQGRRHAARHLRDHGQGPAGRAGQAADHAAAGRRGPHQYRLEQAVGEGQRALREELPGHRHRRRGVARPPGSRC